jgi:hypothetical protein
MDISGSVSALREKRKDNMDQGMNFKQKIVLIVMDILILIELMFSIYLGYRNQENITVIFLKTYIPAVIVTIIIGRVFIKKLRSQEVKG